MDDNNSMRLSSLTISSPLTVGIKRECVISENTNNDDKLVISSSDNYVDINSLMEPILIEVPIGENVLETLVNLAQSHNAGIVILSGSGLVSDVTLRCPTSHAPAPFEGQFHMTSLFGTYFNAPQFTDTCPLRSFFSILFSNNHGEIFGGIVKGEIKAAGVVMITGFLFRKPKFHRIDIVNGSFHEMEEYYDEDEEEEEDDDDDEEGEEEEEEDDTDVDAVVANNVIINADGHAPEHLY